MKVLLTFIVLLLAASVHAQSRPSGASSPNKWAIVVGISSYQNPVLSLQYADRDAKAFSDYLQTRSGGNVPASHILLLLNENATYPAIYNALDSLQGICQKDDIVYFYFSGHGDVESSTIYKLGFLLAYNTPRTNYINNAVRIEDLNIFANTLSVKNQAKVILITDACHSGKLAGSDFRASTLIGQQLRTVQKSEIRITSCAPDQLSAEDAGWGGGRGAFSYYLLNGLNGYADLDHDNVVTLREIGQFLDSALSTDQLLQQRAMKQTPVVTGKDDFRLSQVSSSSHTAPIVLAGAAPAPRGPMPAVLPPQPQTYFFNAWKDIVPEDVFSFSSLDSLGDADLPTGFINAVKQRLISVQQTGNDSVTQLQLHNLSLLEQSVKTNPDALQRFRSRLADMLNKRGDDVINLYLQGDAAEMARRSYYNSLGDDYTEYVHMFSVAAKLTPATAYMRRILDVKTQYFRGVALRLKIPTVKDPRSLIEASLAAQLKALELEPNAAYIHNELGVLYVMKQQWAAAQKEFNLATLIAPQWAIPWANLASVYSQQKATWQKADDAFHQAVMLQPDYQGAWMSAGLLNEQKGLLLSAEEQFRKSIWINSRHYLPFERLANIYQRTTQYALADSFYFEADIRKRGFHFVDMPGRPVVIAAPMAFEPHIPCAFDSSDIGPKDVMGNFVLAMNALMYGDTAWAEKRLQQVIQLDPNNPLAFHYLGKIFYRQQRWQEAAVIFKFALSNRLERAGFDAYSDSLLRRSVANKSTPCIDSEYRYYYYKYVEDDYLAGRLYERWHYFDKAEAHYRAIIRQLPDKMDGYYLLWNMQEAIDRYEDAETTLQQFWQVSQRGKEELYDFYARAIRRFPSEAAWYAKAGGFLHRVFYNDPEAYPYDHKRLEPDTHQEVYLIFSNDPTRPQMGARMGGAQTIMPGIEEVMTGARRFFYPLTDGITYLEKADSLFAGDEGVLANIHYKLGDLLLWQGLGEKAAPWYEKAVAVQPFNAAGRRTLIDIYDTTGQFTSARVQLDSLLKRKEIDFDKQLLMAQYAMHQGEYILADSLLKGAKKLYPYPLVHTMELYARLQWLSGKAGSAVQAYVALLAQKPADPNFLYSLARCYATSGKNAQAWQFLEMAVSKGFNYSWVLNADSTWHSFRRMAKWKQLLAKVKPIQYPEPPRS